MVYFLANTTPSVGAIPLDGGRSNFNAGVEFANPDQVNWKVKERAKEGSLVIAEQGYPVNPNTLVKAMLWPGGDMALPDILPHWAVSTRFRDFVERFEPGVHQFVPVEIYKERGGTLLAPYYWFVVCQRIDSVDRAHTTFLWKAPKEDPNAGHWTRHVIDHVTLDITEIPGAKLVFNNRQPGDHHIWHDPHLLTFRNGLCSDVLGEAAIATDFRGLTVSPRESV